MGKIASFKKDFEDYFGNEYTYLTLKKLLKIYIDGVLLYLYKDEILTYSEILNKYDKENEFQKNLKDIVKSHDNFWLKSIIDIDPEVQELEYKCLSVKDHQDLTKDPLNKLKVDLKLVNIYRNRKIIKPNFITELYKYNLVQKDLKSL